jgi:flagella basal body P-ring formation protein FlgA
VAEIFAAGGQTSDDLGGIELFPAPSRQRFLRLRELQDLLLLRGVDLTKHQLSGSSQVTIHRGGEKVAKKTVEKPVSSAAAKRAKRRLSEAIVACLAGQVSAELPWSVEFELSQDRARMVNSPRQKITVGGGQSPWTGIQRFEVTLATVEPGKPAAAEPRQFTLDVQVSLPAKMVVAVRSLSRGTIIGPGDVELRMDVQPGRGAKPLYSLDKVVGRQTTRSITAGQILQQESVQAPLLVKRGDVVTVYVRSGGIRIRTNGRSRDDGSLGDLIAVESMLDRKTFFAQVCAAREVEVFARAIAVGGTK